MKHLLLFFGISLLILAGCAPYSQLKPEPELSPAEQTEFLELKKGDKPFLLKKDKKYFVAFPAPQENNFYLVLDVPEKKNFECLFTAELVDGKTVGKPITDESPASKTQCVYPVNPGAPAFFWLINRVPAETLLSLKYRYVPQWRFKFENKYADYRAVYDKNRSDRKIYQTLGVDYHFANFNFKSQIDTLSRRKAELSKVHQELLDLEKLFPSSIKNSTDRAYKDFQNLKMNLEDELNFQTQYLLVLDFFNRENECRGSVPGFLDRAGDFTKYFSQKHALPTNVVKESQFILTGRLQEVVPYYDQLITAKTDDTPFDSAAIRLPLLAGVGTLSETAGIPVSADYTGLICFLKDFDAKSNAYASAQASFKTIHQSVKDARGMPADDFFANILAQSSQAQALIPAALDANCGKYVSGACALKLNQDIEQLRIKANKVIELYRQSDALIRALNALKTANDYPGMLALLKKGPQPDFILNRYQELDSLSLHFQADAVRTSLNTMAWAKAENGLTRLHQDKVFLNPQKTLPAKAKLVDELEDALYNKVDALTRQKVDTFCVQKAGTLENVDSLYMDSVFLPAYDIKFSSGNHSELLRRKADLVAHLAKLKENEFPVKAIKLLYDEFMKDPDDNGVLKCRAMVAHSKHFTGVDKEIALRVAEVDPRVPKNVSKPTEYRRIFVLPTTDNRTGQNKYLLRVNIKVPSDAKFPVFDVNLRLPKEAAANASETRWYEKLTLNGKPLKNEGRFSITSPTAANNYECQITPVQMDKEKENILEVVFDHRSFKVLSVSVMVQKPIIKKN